jgi:hypothetical protein
VHQRTSRDKQRGKQLKAFQRVSLKPGETKTVRLKLTTAGLSAAAKGRQNVYLVLSQGLRLPAFGLR